ncbi:MAG: hypothetical protein OXC26_25405 [Albidovulum sp.]|nr:hypothetical protein [Albidovulum sp.]
MSDGNCDVRSPSYDTGPLPLDVLSIEEKSILREINGLLRRLQSVSSENRKRNSCSEKSPWEKPEFERTNNVFMIDGSRGVGKTSLLLTLIQGWLKPNEYKGKGENGEHDECGFSEMDTVVRPLPTIDFDPLPPELPLYNWIGQAFYPLVRALSFDRSTRFFEDSYDDHPKNSLMSKFREMQTTAAVGWSSGLIREEIAKHAGELPLWQEEQLSRWQDLPNKWRLFLDSLLTELERSKSIDPGFPKDALIALPIDDLDLQVRRSRELMVALRVLRHERLVFVLTGDKDNTEKSLETSFYRDYASGIRSITDGSMDELVENSRELGQKLLKKIIPSSQIFPMEGIPIWEVVDWHPPSHDKRIGVGNSRKFGDLLDSMWKDATKPLKSGEYLGIEKLSDLLKAKKTGDDQINLRFRLLQNFYDRWSGKNNGGNLSEIAEFVRILLEDPNEDKLIVSESRSNGPIKFVGEPGIAAGAPRVRDSISTDQNGISLNWAKDLEFICRKVNKIDNEDILYNSASPQLMLAFDLVARDPKCFELGVDLSFAKDSLGLVWTEDSNTHTVLPWPLIRNPKCPEDWTELAKKWKSARENCWNRIPAPNECELLMAWCWLSSKKEDECKRKEIEKVGAKDRLECHLDWLDLEKYPSLAILGSDELGLSKTVKEIVRNKLKINEKDWETHVESAAWKSHKPLDQISSNDLAFVPILGRRIKDVKTEYLEEQKERLRNLD